MQQYTKAQTAALATLREAAGDGRDAYTLDNKHTCACCFTTVTAATARNLEKKGLVTLTDRRYFSPVLGPYWRTLITLTEDGMTAAL